MGMVKFEYLLFKEKLVTEKKKKRKKVSRSELNLKISCAGKTVILFP